MVFHLNLQAGQSILRNLKTMPFLSKAIKTCIQLYKEFPDPKANYGVRYSYYQSGWRGLENNVQDETVACSKKAKKTDPISSSSWKSWCGLLFWNYISHKNTLRTKQNWQCWIYYLLLFCLLLPLFVPLPWKRRGYLSLQPFYNNVPFLTKQQRKYQVKPLPLSNDQVNSVSVFQAARAHSHMYTHTTLLMWSVQFVIHISVLLVCYIYLDTLKGKGEFEFLFMLCLLGTSKWLKAGTLDGDRGNWLPG